MNLKKLLTSGAVCAALLAVLVVPASAHHGGGHHANAASYAVCTVDGCTETGRHTHGGVTYCGAGHDGYTCASGRHHGGHC